MGLVLCGLVLVGVSDVVFNQQSSSKSINAIITGDLLIIMAQVIVAVQMVYEQSVLSKYNVPPLQAVGLEGDDTILIILYTIKWMHVVLLYFILIPLCR